MVKPTVPRCRAIYPGTKGKDVVAVKRALSRAGYIKWGDFTPVAGEYFMRALTEFCHDHGIPGKISGYGKGAHVALVGTRSKGNPKEWAFDAYSIMLMREQCTILAETPEERIRKAIVAYARYLYAHRYDIHYSQSRPFLYGKPPFVPSREDCSGFVAACHYAAGAPNPNKAWDGSRFPWGDGYTGTMMAAGTKVAKSELKPGDAVMYGFSVRSTPAFPYGSPTHVALWEGEDDNVFSLGSYPMKHTYYRYRHDINCYLHFKVI